MASEPEQVVAAGNLINSTRSRHEELIGESLSALVDGEVSEMELHRVLGATEKDDQLRMR